MQFLNMNAPLSITTFVIAAVVLCDFCHANSSGGMHPSSFGSLSNLGYNEQQIQHQQWQRQQQQQQPQQQQPQQQGGYYNENHLQRLATNEEQQQQQNQKQHDGYYSEKQELISPAVSEEVPVAPLPPGWTEHVDPSSGLPYYYFAEDGTTTWDRPFAEVIPQEVDTPVANAEYKAVVEPPAPSDEIEPLQNGTVTSSTDDRTDALNALTAITRDEERVREEEAWRGSQGWNQPPPNVDDSTQQRTSPPQTHSGSWGMPPQPNERPTQNAGWGLNRAQSEAATHDADVLEPEPKQYGEAMAPPPQQYPPSTSALPQQQPVDPKRVDDFKTIAEVRSVNHYQPSQDGAPLFAQITPQNRDLGEQLIPIKQEGTKVSQQGQHIQRTPGHQAESPPTQHAGQFGLADRPGAHPARIPQQLPPSEQHIPPGQSLPQHQIPQQPSSRAFGEQPPPQRQPQGPDPALQSSHRIPPFPQSQHAYGQQPLSQQQQQPQYQQGQGGYTYGQRPPPQQNTYGGQYGQPPPNQYRSDYGGEYQGQQGYRPNPGQGQLVVQEPPSALRESIGRTWQSLLGLGNRTKEVMETATTTMAQTTRDATLSLTEKSSGWLGIAKSALGSVFESGADASSEYQLSGIYGNVPPAANINPGPLYAQRAPQNYPQQPQQGYPPRQGHPPNQQPGMGQQIPQRSYPPNYNGPQPRADVPHPFQQQQQRQAHLPPSQTQWGAVGPGPQQPGYPPQNGPFDPNRSQQYPPQGGGRPGQHQVPQSHGQRQQGRSQASEKPDPWSHPGLGHEY